MRLCEVEDCEKPTKSGALCSMHWARHYTHGGVDLPVKEWFPAAPLVEMVAERGGIFACTADRLLQKAFYRARNLGKVNVGNADRLALRVLGVHPWEVWPDLWFAQEPHTVVAQPSSTIVA